MLTPHTTLPCQLEIRTEYDVIVLRQEVRQTARMLGMGLTQQAKIAAAISTIARALVAADFHATMLMSLEKTAARSAIEISCDVSPGQSAFDLVQLTQLIHFGDAQTLVDEAALSLNNGVAHCSLRMWLT